MIAGGHDRCNLDCGSKLNSLFDEFQYLDNVVAAFQEGSGGKVAVVKLGNKELRLSSNGQKGWHHLESYSRTTKMDDGKWVTVQIRRWNGLIRKLALDIFDDKGKVIAAIVRDIINDGGYDRGKDLIIKGALRAVTGKDYPVVVAAK